MGKYDEFDLDLKTSSSDGSGDDASPQSVTGFPCELSLVSLDSILNSCTSEYCNFTDSCPKTAACTGTGNTCTCYC